MTDNNNIYAQKYIARLKNNGMTLTIRLNKVVTRVLVGITYMNITI